MNDQSKPYFPPALTPRAKEMMLEAVRIQQKMFPLAMKGAAELKRHCTPQEKAHLVACRQLVETGEEVIDDREKIVLLGILNRLITDLEIAGV